MRIKEAVAFVTFLLCCVLNSSAQNSVDLHKLSESVDRHYNSLNSLQAEFSESYSGAGMTRNESGVMLVKKPGRMRWDYTTPLPKVFVTDGKVAWFYVPGERRARRAAMKNLDDLRSPLRYLLGRTKLEKEFSGLTLLPTEKPTQAGNVVLRGIPRRMEDRVSFVLLEITPESRIARILIEELDGSRTEFRFHSQKDNVQVSDARFNFKPPAGVEIMEANELEP